MTEKTWCLTDNMIYPWDGYCFIHEYDVYVPEDFLNEFENLVAETTQTTDKTLGDLAKHIADYWQANDAFEKAWQWVQDTDALDDYLMAYYQVAEKDKDPTLPDSEPIIVSSGLDVSDLFVEAMCWHVEKLVKEDLHAWVLRMWTHKAIFKLELELTEEQFECVEEHVRPITRYGMFDKDYAWVERGVREYCDTHKIPYHKEEEVK